MRRWPALWPALVATALLALAGCGGNDDGPDGAPRPVPGAQDQPSPGFAAFATKNTTRIGGTDPIANAAATAQAVFPSGEKGDRPKAVVLTDSDDWQTALAASALAAAPIGAPLLFTDGKSLPETTSKALSSLDPTGSKALGGAEVIRVGPTADPAEYKSVDVVGADEFERARAIDALLTANGGQRPEQVIVTGTADAGAAMPAAGLAAKTGAPILFVEKDSVPDPTRDALAAHGKPKIVVIGSGDSVGPKAIAELKQLGSVTVTGDSADPAAAAVQVARFTSGGFGWGIVDPGHGLVFARSSSPLSAAAAAPLSANGTYAPLLLLDSATRLPSATSAYLRQIQPGHKGDPTRGVYNHGWIIGDETAISVPVQSDIDAKLEIKRVNQ